ncbi:MULTISPECIES: hypothetical protein [unclassified Methylobacterium]
MDNFVKLEKKTSSEIDQLLRSAGLAARTADLNQAITLCLKAWARLPEPKDRWDFYPQIISRGLVEYYTKIGDKENMEKWIDLTYYAYRDDSRTDIFLNMLEAECLYKMGIDSRAFDIIAQVEKVTGKIPPENLNNASVKAYLNSASIKS